MKHLLFIALTILATLDGQCQKYRLADGDYMDTTSAMNLPCPDYNAYYYQVGGKYPKSSATLLKEVESFMEQYDYSYKGSGYLTFRFKIDCEGNRVKKTQVLQTDENYQRFTFDKKFVTELYQFLDTLKDWKIVKDPNGNALSYAVFITFKIKNGKVVNIIP